jgi:hypothetical protein
VAIRVHAEALGEGEDGGELLREIVGGHGCCDSCC